MNFSPSREPRSPRVGQFRAGQRQLAVADGAGSVAGYGPQSSGCARGKGAPPTPGSRPNARQAHRGVGLAAIVGKRRLSHAVVEDISTSLPSILASAHRMSAQLRRDRSPDRCLQLTIMERDEFRSQARVRFKGAPRD